MVLTTGAPGRPVRSSSHSNPVPKAEEKALGVTAAAWQRGTKNGRGCVVVLLGGKLVHKKLGRRKFGKIDHGVI